MTVFLWSAKWINFCSYFFPKKIAFAFDVVVFSPPLFILLIFLPDEENLSKVICYLLIFVLFKLVQGASKR